MYKVFSVLVNSHTRRARSRSPANFTNRNLSTLLSDELCSAVRSSRAKGAPSFGRTRLWYFSCGVLRDQEWRTRLFRQTDGGSQSKDGAFQHVMDVCSR